MGIPIAPAQRQAFAQRRFVDLNDGNAGGLQIGDLIAQRQRDLATDLSPR
jgi:hypothetical protein